MRLVAGRFRPFALIAISSGLLGGCLHAFDPLPQQRSSIKDHPADAGVDATARPVVKASYAVPPAPRRPAHRVVEAAPQVPKVAKNDPPVFVGTPTEPVRKAEPKPVAAPIRPASAPAEPEIAKPMQGVTETPALAPAAPPVAQPEKKVAAIVVPPLPFVVPVPMSPPASASAAAAAPPVAPAVAPRPSTAGLTPLPPLAPAAQPAPAPAQPTLVMPPPAAQPKMPEKTVAAPPVEPARTAARRAEPAPAIPPKVEVIVPAKPDVKAEAPKVETKSEQQAASAANILKQVPAPQPQTKTVALPKSPADELVDRASLLMSVGNVASARDLLNEAARGGSTAALVELGGSYDPLALVKFVAVPPGAADAQRALGYYEQASAKGSDVAKARIDALKAHLAKAK